jgi:tape measure domain-containing protein
MTQPHERILTEYTADTRNFRRGAKVYSDTLASQERLTNSRLGRIDSRWQSSQRTILNTRTSLLALGAALGVAQVRNYAEAWRNVERRLQSIGANSVDAQKAVVGLALRTRSVVGGTAEAVQRMAKSTDGDFSRAARRVETLQKLLAAGGASGTERASVSLQLGQALKSGKLSGDEFRSISENAPVEFLESLADAAGITRKELKQFAQDQKLTTDIVLVALDQLAATADKNFRQISVSGEEAFDVLSTGLTFYVGQVDQSLGATAAFNATMVSLGEDLADSGEGAENLASALQVVAVAALAVAGSRGYGAMAAAFQNAAVARRADVTESARQVAVQKELVAQSKLSLNAANNRQRAAAAEYEARSRAGKATKRALKSYQAATVAQEKAANALAGANARAVTATNTLTAAQARLSVATRVTTAAMRTMNGVMAFFGGPVGLAITAITVAVAVMGQMKSRSEDLTGAFDTLNNTLGKASDVNQKLAGDYKTLEKASDDLATAIEKGGTAAVNAATLEVESIRQRIAANETYRLELSALAKLELAEAKSKFAAIEAAELDSVKRRIARQRMDARPAIERLKGGRQEGLLAIYRSISEQDVQDYVEVQRDLAVAAALAGEALSDEQQELLKNSTAMLEARIQVRELETKVGTLTAAAPDLGVALDDAGRGALVLAQNAREAQAGISGLIKLIPELAKVAKIEGQIAQAQKDRDAALAGLGDAKLSSAQRIREEERILDFYARAISEIDGTADATRRADDALDAYLDGARLEALDARGQALAREAAKYADIVAALDKAKAGEDAYAQAQAANASIQAQINARYDEKAGKSSSKNRERQLSELRELLVESGNKQIYIEQALYDARERLRSQVPELVKMGLSRADAEVAVAGALERVKQGLEDVRTASEDASRAMAKNILNDIRNADSLADAVSRISDRLMDLAYDQAFDLLADQFARLTAPDSSGGWLGDLIGTVFGGNSGNSTTNTSGRAAGGPMAAGVPYWANENTPRSEIFVPSGSGAMLNVAQAQTALRNSVGQSQVMVAPQAPQINIFNNASGVEVSAVPGAGGRVDIMVERAMGDAIGRGRLDGPLKQRFGIKPGPKGN